ncbi:hypothetical protein RJT34_13591 [Clitoria ternatea]|uniref:Uncharacterized protein n=1 Tax=Clitoria ternatea TaxID=43366 RepID=A0AAN9JNV0_CLITE
MRTSWSSSECTKENLSPTALNSSLKPYKPKFKSHNTNKVKVFSSFADDKKKNINDEIQEIETEIKRLTTCLDTDGVESSEIVFLEASGDHQRRNGENLCRYNNRQCGDVRKRSLPENGEGSEVRVKKRWEVPNKSSEEEQEQGVSGMVFLPKIKTLKCVNESPRDSGVVKRVAELVGKKSYFYLDERGCFLGSRFS